MKLIFAVLDVSLTMGLTRCYKTEGFFYIYKHTIMINFIKYFRYVLCTYLQLNLVYCSNQ